MLPPSSTMYSFSPKSTVTTVREGERESERKLHCHSGSMVVAGRRACTVFLLAYSKQVV